MIDCFTVQMEQKDCGRPCLLAAELWSLALVCSVGWTHLHFASLRRQYMPYLHGRLAFLYYLPPLNCPNHSAAPLRTWKLISRVIPLPVFLENRLLCPALYKALFFNSILLEEEEAKSLLKAMIFVG